MVRIRKGTDEDLNHLPDMLIRAYTGLDEYGEENPEKARKYLLDLYNQDPECFYVAEVNGDIVGFIFCSRFWYSKFEKETLGEIHEIVVLPEFKGKSVGSALLKKAIGVLKSKKIELWVGEKNEGAIKFYEKFGFKKKEKVGMWIRMILDREKVKVPVVGHESSVEPVYYENEPEVHGVQKKVLISPKDGWEGWVMRLFQLKPGGYTPKHSHPWPHINYIVKGNGVLHIDGVDYDIHEGSYAFVPPDSEHQFRNDSQDELWFICIVPEEGDI